MGLFKNRAEAKDDAPDTGETLAPDVVTDGDVGVSGAEMQRLWSDGVPALATITEVRDTGQRLAGNAVLDLDLTVTRDGAESYDTTLRLAIAGDEAESFSPGSAYNVRVDPQDHTKLAFAA